MINKKQMWSDNPFDQWTEEELLCMEYQSICYGKGGGSAPPPPPSSVQQSTTAEFPTELRPFISDIFSKAQAVQEQRQEEGFRPELTQQLASFTPDQQAAFTGIREQVGQTRPLFEEATNLARGATRAATDPAEVGALMNPFLRNVTDIEKREAQRVADVQEQRLAAQAAQAGAFGGSRAAVLEAERQRNLAQQLGDIEARGRLAAFQDAQTRLQNQFGRESAGAAQLSALGAAIPAQTFKELGALSGIGASEQQQTQRALDIATQQAREEYGFPMATLQDFQSILRGFPLPATTNVSKQTFSPAQPLSTQLLGLGTGLAGLAGVAGAFKKAGGLVGVPVAMKNGGYVKLAGGGGLGQLMQGKLPSNRVRMGKVAYQDASPVARVPSGTLFEMTQEILDILEEKGAAGLAEIQEKFPRDVVNFALNQVNTPRAQPAPVAGQIATQGIESASAVSSPAVPIPTNIDDSNALVSAPPPVSVVASQVPVSPLASIADVVSGMYDDKSIEQLESDQAGETLDPGGVAPALDKMRPGLIQRIRSQFPYAGSVSPTLGTIPKDVAPPAPPIPSAELRSTAPTGDFSPETTEDVGSFLGGTDYRQVQQDRPSELEDPSGFGSLVRGNPRLNKFALQRAQEGFSKGLIAYPPELLSIQDPKERIAALSEHRDKILTDRGQQSSELGAVVPRLENRPRDLNPPMPFQGVVDVAKKVGEAVIPTTMMPVLDEGDPNINKALTETTAGMLLPDASDIDPDPVDFNNRIRIGDAVKTEVQGTDPAAKAPAEGPKAPAAGPKAPSADSLTGEEPKDPAKVAAAQKSYDQQIADIKNKDYSADIKDMIGDAPTYEKGEEPDFAARKWLALANFGAGILASGGGKTLAQSIGEAAKPALKELVDIGKEERKIKKELRQERNAQKRADYQDDLQRFNLQRQLRSDDLDHTKAMADIADKKARRIIDDKTLEERVRANTALINKQIIDTATAQYALDNAKTGRTTSGQAQKAILDSIQQTRNTIIKSRQLGFPTSVAEENREIMSAAQQTAALYAPTTFKEVKGKDGKIRLEKVDLTKFIPNLGGTPKGGTTVVVPGSKATITMGNVSK